MALAVTRQKHDRKPGDAATTQRRRRLAPGTLDRLLARVLQPRQVVNAGAADNTKHRFYHIRSIAPFRGLQSGTNGLPIARFQSYASFMGDLERECGFGIRPSAPWLETPIAQ